MVALILKCEYYHFVEYLTPQQREHTMIDKALSLFERLVIALETIAANQQASSTVVQNVTSKAAEKEAKKVADEIDEAQEKKTSTKAKTNTKPSTRKAKAAEPEDEPEPEEEETKKTRTRKSKAKGDDKLDEKRDAIKEIATLISEDDSDDAEDMEDALDELLEKFDVKKVADLEDDQVAEFYSELLEVANEWFELEEIK